MCHTREAASQRTHLRPRLRMHPRLLPPLHLALRGCRWNFGAGVLKDPLKAEYIEKQIAGYDSLDAGTVCLRAREVADMAAMTRKLVNLYEQAIFAFSRIMPDHAAENVVVADYIAEWHYDRRIDWEQEQIYTLKQLPFIRGPLRSVAQSIFHRWMKSSSAR
jgi:hypothetical protein